MGCPSCGKSSVTVVPQPLPRQNNANAYNEVVIVPCDYTLAQLNVWLNKLICCKDSGMYMGLGVAAPLMNKYLGIVMSALNYPTNPCYFKKDLDNIANLIILIQNNGAC